LAKALDGWDASRPLVYADEAGDDVGEPWGGERGRARPVAEALKDAGGPTMLALLIGPEGGFTPEERRMLRGLPYVIPVSLGPRILRAETAVIAALSVIQSAWGDWRAS
jgi:16S rRNA (uracil1498-N3)-methyltransferase